MRTLRWSGSRKRTELKGIGKRSLDCQAATGEESTMTVSVFIGTSVDGFIARPNGDLDFLPAGGGEPHGYNEFMASVDALVIGRKTFETVLALAAWPYGDKRVVVQPTRRLVRGARRRCGTDGRAAG